MSRFHESIREFLEDVNLFLSETIHQEVLSSRAITQKEALLMKLQMLNRLYPQLQLNINQNSQDTEGVPSSPVSLTPYIDMQGNSTRKDFGDMFEDSYELCENEKSVSSELQSSFDLDENRSPDECKYPLLPASQVQVFEKYGYLEKKSRERFGGLINKYQRRWYGLRDGLMFYYEKSTDQSQKGVIQLSGYEVREVQKDSKKKNYYSFELVCPGKHTYQFTAVSEKDMKQWITAIERNNKGYMRSSQKDNYQTNGPCDGSNGAIYDDSCNTEEIYEMVEGEEQNLKHNHTSSSDTITGDLERIPAKDSNCNSGTSPNVFDYQNLYVGLWDCEGDDETELDFHYGDVIRILSKEYDSYAWWIGELNGRIGFVPKAYLMEAYSTY